MPPVVLLSAEALAALETVSEAELHSWYDSNVRVKFEERAAARKKAEDLLAQLRAAPDKFATLAGQYSQDPGSKDKGGDLGFTSPVAPWSNLSRTRYSS